MEPRLFCIPATESSVVAVLRRGPSDWCHVGRWDPVAGTWLPGSWLHGTIYPQRCDLSPDGRWLVAFILQPGAAWAQGWTYLIVSRLPWLSSLAAWATDGSWTRGFDFVAKGAASLPPAPPDTGDLAPLLRRYDLEFRRPATFGVERSRGWTEAPETPPSDPNDPWEIRRASNITLQKARPGQPSTRLLVRGWYAAFREGEPARGPAEYWTERDGVSDLQPLPGVQWADWAADGRLLVATTTGSLQVREEPAGLPTWHVDLAALQPDPQPPPDEASEW